MTPVTGNWYLPERVPAVGELVLVRLRRWLVEEVESASKPGLSPVVSLACAADDAQGQTLQVYWDYEPDRMIVEDEGWDDLAARGFDTPCRFAAFFHTLRWSSVTATDPGLFQSPFRAGIKIDAYQMEPLRKALLLPRVNLFIISANLTEAALDRNIELGLLVRDPALGATVVMHFRGPIERGLLKPLPGA